MSAPQDALHTSNLPFLEEVREESLRDPRAVSPDLKRRLPELFGDGGEKRPSPKAATAGGKEGGNGALAGARPSFQPKSYFRARARRRGRSGRADVAPPLQAPIGSPPSAAPPGLREAVPADEVRPVSTARAGLRFAELQDRVDQLVRAFRTRGHKCAAFNPLADATTIRPDLGIEYFGLTEAELDLAFSSDTIPGNQRRTLREIVERLRSTYCRSIGVEYMHIDDPTVRWWLRDRMESTGNRLSLSREEQVRIFTCLTDAVLFEEFLHKKFQGAKSFSLEGAESLIPLLDCAIEKSGEQRVDEIVIAMAHRGRLNVLANIMGKRFQQIFSEFEDGVPERHIGGGDVKYHLGFSSERVTRSGQRIHLSLCFNPSHLEFVNPVALGRMRAKQDRFGDEERVRGLTIMIHGDAAFAGQGVTQETLNLSQLPAYTTGGSVHVIVNNQIGFTTNPEEGRSGDYASSIARFLQIPIFHVNGEDPEAVSQVVRLALEFRRQFHRDVVIDLYCYRRRGHNEGDEPSFTQPLMYKIIRSRPSVRDGYLRRLLELGGITQEEADAITTERQDTLERALREVRAQEFHDEPEAPNGVWRGYLGGPEDAIPEAETGVPVERLLPILEHLARVPEGFTPHPRLRRLLESRRLMAEAEQKLDWGTAELLAFATLGLDGTPVRLSGQDSERGTFGQRHAVLHDYETGERYRPLQHLDTSQAPIEIWNSPLSEIGVLGFEYGYSLDRPEGLVLWEAQFGDFVNVAQVIIDQFIASAEDKWRRLSGLVLLLPHGFEGMGPEHSSARLERFLTLAAEHNIQIVQPTTPAQHFHCLRRQAIRPWRKPLVVLTPKSLLRLPEATSSLDELASGTFARVIPDVDGPAPAHARRVLLVSGKLFYELDKARKQQGRDDVLLVRVEQLYPFPLEQLADTLREVPDGTPTFWVQEEPENMGAWRTVRVLVGERLLHRLPFSGIYRPESASPATGSLASHRYEQGRLLSEALEAER